MIDKETHRLSMPILSTVIGKKASLSRNSIFSQFVLYLLLGFVNQAIV